ncbi:hypothetical protein PoB_000204900 [Plakobranchus ocellatus]|uniref:Uncharacterized protein n=1 Tax=Plakobranchus ocellatus TaxID=259542 RepID=A0AAV3Y024_9GAST|nr:hypothetical protein PoB_000204900 [Plakobranchus ocellatus]
MNTAVHNRSPSTRSSCTPTREKSSSNGHRCDQMRKLRVSQPSQNFSDKPPNEVKCKPPKGFRSVSSTDGSRGRSYAQVMKYNPKIQHNNGKYPVTQTNLNREP